MQRANITCHAADQDGDLLHYTWLSTGGMIVGDSPPIGSTAPDQPGNYRISCEVEDHLRERTLTSIQLLVTDQARN